VSRYSKHHDYYVTTNARAHYERGGKIEAEKAENRQVIQMLDNLYSHGGTVTQNVERNDDGTYDADSGNLRELEIVLQQAAHEDQPQEVRADVPPNEAAANFNQLANIRTGQGVRELKYRWGQGAQTAQEQPFDIKNAEDQAEQYYQDDGDQ
jgi:hypothetical protein